MKIAVMQVNQSAPAQKQSTKSKESNDSNRSFASQLSEASSEPTEASAQSKAASTNTETNKQAEPPKDMKEFVETLGEDLQEAIEQLPIEAGYLNLSLLQTEDMQALLSSLPQELSQKLQSLFQNNSTMEGILESIKGWEPKEQFLAMLMGMTNLEKQMSKEQQQLFSKMLENIKAQVQLPKGKEIASLAEFVKALTKEAGKEDKGVMQVLANNIPNEKKDLHSLNNRFYNTINHALLKGEKNRTEDKQSLPQGVKQVLDSLNTKTEQIGVRLDSEQPQQRLQQTIQLNPNQAKPSMQQQFVEQFQKIMQNSRFASFTNGNAQLTLKLNPEHLGTLSIKLVQMNGEMAARIIASTQSAKDLIESNIHQLRHLFSGQNVQVEKFEVNLQNQQQYQPFKENQGNPNGQQNEQEQEPSQENDEQAKSFAESFEEELLNIMT
ncbi:flagellar hook-length control protein FliK [Bacillus tianshenii]|nr:flagellar hook-length control protein FliK [Bacillus tianshenii]